MPKLRNVIRHQEVADRSIIEAASAEEAGDCPRGYLSGTWAVMGDVAPAFVLGSLLAQIPLPTTNQLVDKRDNGPRHGR